MSDHERRGPMNPGTPGESPEDRLRRLLDERAQGFPLYRGAPAATVRRARRAVAVSVLTVVVAAAGIGVGAAAGLHLLTTASPRLGGSPTPSPVVRSESPSPSPTPSPTSSPSPSSSPSAAPAGGVQVVAPLEGPPSRLATDGNAVYAIYEKDPATQGSTLLARLDLATGAVVKSDPIPFARNLALAGGSLWVTAASTGQGRAGNVHALYRLDPGTLAKLDTVQLPETPGSLVLTSAGLWVGGTSHLYLREPAAGGPLLTVGVDGEVGALATDPASDVLYVSTHHGQDLTPLPLTERDAATGSVLATSKQLPGLAVNSLSATAQGVWVAFPTGMMSQVALFSSSSSSDLQQLASYSPKEGEGVTNSTTADALGGILWIADSMATQITCADPSSGDLRGTVPISGDLSGGYGLSNIVTSGQTGYVGTGPGIVSFPIEATCTGT